MIKVIGTLPTDYVRNLALMLMSMAGINVAGIHGGVVPVLDGSALPAATSGVLRPLHLVDSDVQHPPHAAGKDAPRPSISRPSPLMLQRRSPAPGPRPTVTYDYAAVRYYERPVGVKYYLPYNDDRPPLTASFPGVTLNLPAYTAGDADTELTLELELTPDDNKSLDRVLHVVSLLEDVTADDPNVQMLITYAAELRRQLSVRSLTKGS